MKFDNIVSVILENFKLRYSVKVMSSGFSRKINNQWKEFWTAETIASSPESAIANVFSNYAKEKNISKNVYNLEFSKFKKNDKVKHIPSELG